MRALVTHGHFRSREKDMAVHTIGSAASENPMLHANFTALYVLYFGVTADQSFTLREE